MILTQPYRSFAGENIGINWVMDLKRFVQVMLYEYDKVVLQMKLPRMVGNKENLKYAALIPTKDIDKLSSKYGDELESEVHFNKPVIKKVKVKYCDML